MKRLRTWHFYSLADGALVGRNFSAHDEKHLAANIPAGCGAIEGVTHPTAQRVDLETRTLVDFIPEAPDGDHEWDGTARRWRLSSASIERASLKRRILELEAAQPRALREHALGDTAAIGRLRAIDAEIASLRRQL